jgi:hypothetical protein
MSNAASWAVSAANKFREVARTTENPTTKQLAEGLTHLSEAVRELHQEPLCAAMTAPECRKSWNRRSVRFALSRAL